MHASALVWAHCGANVNQPIRTLLAGGLLTLALFGSAAAGPLEDGQAAYQKGDYATALKIYRPLAEHGNASAQTALGVITSMARACRRTSYRP